MREKLLERLEAHFGADERRIDHARRVLQAAEELMAAIPAEPRIVVPAADIEAICAIIAHHHSPGIIETRDFAAVYDADCIVNLAETAGKVPKEQLARTIDDMLLTEAGRKLAMRRYRGG